MNWLRIALGAACAAVLGIGVATAAVVPSNASVAITTNACHELPVSERGICASLHTPSQPPVLTAAQRTTLRSENARYRVAAAACHTLPVSERGICVNEATLKLETAAQRG